MNRSECIYYGREELCLSRKRPNCPWWREGVCAIAGKVGEKRERPKTEAEGRTG